MDDIFSAIQQRDVAGLLAAIAVCDDVDAPRNESGDTPLLAALRQEEYNLVHLLLRAGADPDFIPQGQLRSPLCVAARIRRDPNLFRLLQQFGADARATNADGDSTLTQLLSLAFEDVNIVMSLLAMGLNVTFADIGHAGTDRILHLLMEHAGEGFEEFFEQNRLAAAELRRCGANFRCSSIIDSQGLAKTCIVGEVSFWGCDVGDRDLELLLGLDHLCRVDLTRTKITDEAGAVLAQLPNLERISAWETAVTDGFVDRLSGHPRLRTMSVHRTAITRQRADWERGFRVLTGKRAAT